MSGVGGQDAARELARGLSLLVSQALGDHAPIGSLDAARHLAQLLSLQGLDRLLDALSPHAAGVWPAELRPAVEQVRRAAEACGREGNVEPLRRLDEQLGLMARAIDRVPAVRDPAAPRTSASREARPAVDSAPVPLAVALEGLPVQRDHEELLHRIRLQPPVAGALRAALDWLLGDAVPQLRLWLSSDGSALEVTCEGVVFSGIQPASEVLASVGAHLGTTGDRPGAWTVRVPILAERETFLMLEQDDLPLAVPWHAVVRVRLMPADTIDAMARRQGLQVLPPLAVASRRAAEQPVVVVALGLKRACLVADRLVWRMPARPAEATGAPPAPGIVRVVRSDDDDHYWVLEPAWLLRDVAAPVMAEAGRSTPRHSAGPRSEPPRVTPPARLPIPFPTAAARAPVEEPAVDAMPALTPQDVEPLEAPAPDPIAPLPVTAAPSESPAHSAPPEASAPSHAPARAAAPSAPREPAAHAQPSRPPAPAVGQALVAEDSITARIFLVRLLEQRGLAVHAVSTAAQLRALLPHGPWAVVCADVELPDARGEAFLLELMRSAGSSHSPLVALVRDAADEAMARAAGVAATLRKPYEREALDRVLARLVPNLPGGARPGDGGTADPREWGAR